MSHFPAFLFALSLSATLCTLTGYTQEKPAEGKNWQLLDRQQDGVNGTSVNRAYAELLKGKKSYPVIVAVLDLGTDTLHEDLQGHIWTNTREIPGNGIDDDHNGYVDDIHGWNFLGGKDGRNIVYESAESYREYYRLRPVYDGIADSSGLPASRRAEYVYWRDLKNKHLADSIQTKGQVIMYTNTLHFVTHADSLLRAELNKDTLYGTDLENLSNLDSAGMKAEKSLLGFLKQTRVSATTPFTEIIKNGQKLVKSTTIKQINQQIDPYAQRHDIVGDDPTNINDRLYGNNNVSAGYPDHGTHVAGIIAAIRGNGVGLDGITDRVLIMPVRVACLGDEWDKDVALGIRYAVDNGASVINMSFGKNLSPNKSLVDDAIRYAEKKSVLIVHAAMNDSQDMDVTPTFPTPHLTSDGHTADNFISVGASAAGADSLLVAPFSNYGARECDLFAPGVRIYSSMPGNTYESKGGTSMASPVVAGVAALVLEYYPRLSARQVKYVLMHSVTPFAGTMVLQPGTRKKVDFATLCVSGGEVNAYNALKLAATIQGERK